jgi:hypothetical protein
MIAPEQLVQPDGAVWKRYPIDGGHLVVTQKGQELLHEMPKLPKLLCEYRRLAVGRTALGSSARREYIGHGDHAVVYRFTPDLVIKEGLTRTVFAEQGRPEAPHIQALERMDRVYDVIKTGHETGAVPRWLDMPDHYGAIESANLDRHYMLMQCVDSGITIGDILLEDGEDPDREALVRREFGAVTEEDTEEILDLTARARGMLVGAVEDAGLDPTVYLAESEWHQGNVLVERAPAPVQDSNFKLWVIDQ